MLTDSAMIRSLLKRNYVAIIGIAPLLLWLIGALLFVAVPFLDQRRNVHDESNLRNIFTVSRVSQTSFGSTFDAPPKHIVLSGKRSAGAESFLIVNCGRSSWAAQTLAASLRNEPHFSMDTHFYFLNNCSMAAAIDVPQGLVRGGVLLDIDYDVPEALCVHTFGEGGLQPNQDLVNTVVASLVANGFHTSFLCEQSKTTARTVDFISSFFPPGNAQQWTHYVQYLLSMIQDHRGIRGGGALRSHNGIYMVGVSAQKKGTGRSLALAVALEYVLRGFNNLNERLHHSCPVWISLSIRQFIDFQLAQAVPLVFIGSGTFTVLNCFIFGRAKHFQFSFVMAAVPIVALSTAFPVIEMAVSAGVVTIVFAAGEKFSMPAVAFSTSTWAVSWMVLYLALHPALSIIGNAMLALQLLCLLLSFRHRLLRLVGAGLSLLIAIGAIVAVLPADSPQIDSIAIRSYVFTTAFLTAVSCCAVILR